MSTHLNEEQLVAYVHQTLTDVQREGMDQHLTDCPHCRARLTGHQSLQRRIRHSLLGDLRTARPSSEMSFAAISPHLRRQRRFGEKPSVNVFTCEREFTHKHWGLPSAQSGVFHRFSRSLWTQSVRFFSGVAALITLALQTIILLALLGHMSQPVAGAMLGLPDAGSQPSGSASAGQPPCVGELSPGWFVAADGLEQSVHVCDYEVEVDRTVFHAGQASGVVKSIVSEPMGVGTLMQVFGASEYAGKRIRVSAYVRAEEVEGWAGFWVRVDSSKYRLSYFDRRFDGLIFSAVEGTMEWERRQVVLDVPEDGGAIALGISLEGTGQVWLDDIQFVVVGD